MTEDLVVSTLSGKIRGKVQKDYHGGTFYSFSGIPYAKAPIGELRFKAPQAAEPWDGIWNGKKEGFDCPSVYLPTNFHVGKEDNCLNMNIHTKKLPSSNNTKKLPVMVFIHGGAFFYFSNSSHYFGPHFLLTEEIVLVNINYRLGVLGFLSLNDPSLEVPGNAGLKDQVMALQWIKNNIQKFGGDVNNITVFGESAGSASVHYLLLSPLTKGLFHKAILQSGCALNPWSRGRRNCADIAKLMGYNKDIDEKTLLQNLRKASTKSIISAQMKIEDTFFVHLVRPFGPVIEYPHDGAFLTEDPEKIMKAGKFHHVPLIIGYNSMEGLMFETLRKIRSDVHLPFTLEKDIPFSLNIPEKSEKAKEVAEKLKEFYYKDEEISEDNINIRYTVSGDSIFLHGIQKSIRLLKQNTTAPIYVYKMTLVSSLNFLANFCGTNYHNVYFCLTIIMNWFGKSFFKTLRDKLPGRQIDGVAHADDLCYLFTAAIMPNVVQNSEEDIYIQRFVKLWTNFAKHSDPTPEVDEILKIIKWNKISDENIDNMLEIGKELKNIRNPDGERLAFLENIYNKYAS